MWTVYVSAGPLPILALSSSHLPHPPSICCSSTRWTTKTSTIQQHPLPSDIQHLLHANYHVLHPAPRKEKLLFVSSRVQQVACCVRVAYSYNGRLPRISPPLYETLGRRRLCPCVQSMCGILFSGSQAPPTLHARLDSGSCTHDGNVSHRTVSTLARSSTSSRWLCRPLKALASGLSACSGISLVKRSLLAHLELSRSTVSTLWISPFTHSTAFAFTEDDILPSLSVIEQEPHQRRVCVCDVNTQTLSLGRDSN